MNFGITFSHKYLNDLKLPVDEALKFAVSMNFDLIRLGCYWNEIEKEMDNYDFSSLHKLLNYCEAKGQGIIMNIGVKSPRHPEFYWPTYVESKNFENEKAVGRLYKFIEKISKELKKYKCIKMWQVENEPLDPSGPENMAIPLEILKNEITILKSIDSRPILLTVWGNDAHKRNTIPLLLPLCDYLGLDIYYKVYVGKGFWGNKYSGINNLLPFFADVLKQNPNKILIAEMQAEPWEDNDDFFRDPSKLSKKMGSISVEKIQENLKRTREMGFENIVFWGFEYWYFNYLQTNKRFVDIVNKIIK